MSTFQRRYSERQKRAVGVAQLDQGMTAAAALERLHAGELEDRDGPVPAPPDPMPKSTAHHCARMLRMQREGRRGGLARVPTDVARETLNARLIFAADKLTRRVETAARSGTGPEKLADLLAKAAKAVAAVNAATAEPRPPASRPPSAGTTDSKPPSAPASPASPLERIAAEVEREDRADRRAAAQRPPPNGA